MNKVGEKSKNDGSSGSDKSSGEGESKNESSENSSSGNGSNTIKVMQMQPSNILVIDKDNIDWMTIKSELEVMYTSWNSILVDLHSMNADNNDILTFGQRLDNAIIMAKSEDKANTITMLANLYSYLPKYIEKVSLSGSEKNILQTKSHVLNAYAFVEQDNWTEVQNQINMADDVYANVINDVKYIEKKQEDATRTYVLIKELKNSVSLQDKDIFYIKYKNLMNSI